MRCKLQEQMEKARWCAKEEVSSSLLCHVYVFLRTTLSLSYAVSKINGVTQQ